MGLDQTPSSTRLWSIRWTLVWLSRKSVFDTSRDFEGADIGVQHRCGGGTDHLQRYANFDGLLSWVMNQCQTSFDKSMSVFNILSNKCMSSLVENSPTIIENSDSVYFNAYLARYVSKVGLISQREFIYFIQVLMHEKGWEEPPTWLYPFLKCTSTPTPVLVEEFRRKWMMERCAVMLGNFFSPLLIP